MLKLYWFFMTLECTNYLWPWNMWYCTFFNLKPEIKCTSENLWNLTFQHNLLFLCVPFPNHYSVPWLCCKIQTEVSSISPLHICLSFKSEAWQSFLLEHNNIIFQWSSLRSSLNSGLFQIKVDTMLVPWISSNANIFSSVRSSL